ncbi:hypothetical protein NZJ93_02455 [Desulfofundulus thermocisternus]|nr:hypothetical protein [Desulfofundulus thermocisternus]
MVMHVQAVWDMLSDQKIWNLLGDVQRPLDEDIIRLMFIEIFSRVKVLEEENLALRVLLMEQGLVDEELYAITRRAVREFLKEKDDERARESEFFARSGIPFPEWVNFKLRGTFSDSSNSSEGL